MSHNFKNSLPTNCHVKKLLTRSLATWSHYAWVGVKGVINMKAHEEIFWGNENVLYFEWYGEYNVYICQNPSNCTFKCMYSKVSKLYSVN